MDQSLTHFAEVIQQAGHTGGALRIRGSGSKDWYGQELNGSVLDTRAWHGIVDYEPTELVVTVKTGTRLAELEQTLAEKGQMLAFEPPHFGPDATVGGMLACGLSGPRRVSVGAVRDFVLGTSIMDGRGQVLNFGGNVMKNVAGYDVSRLLCGSLGILGLILEVSLKVLPVPPSELTLEFELSEEDALRKLNTWGGQALPISASAWHAGCLYVRLSGAEEAVSAARAVLGGDTLDAIAAKRIWDELREQALAFFQVSEQDARPLWRVSVPSAAPVLDLGATPWIEWGGSLRWVRSDMPAEQLRALVHQHGGNASLFRGGASGVPRLDALSPAAMRVHRALKAGFDPHGVFNPGRMYKEL